MQQNLRNIRSRCCLSRLTDICCCCRLAMWQVLCFKVEFYTRTQAYLQVHFWLAMPASRVLPLLCVLNVTEISVVRVCVWDVTVTVAQCVFVCVSVCVCVFTTWRHIYFFTVLQLWLYTHTQTHTHILTHAYVHCASFEFQNCWNVHTYFMLCINWLTVSPVPVPDHAEGPGAVIDVCTQAKSFKG